MARSPTPDRRASCSTPTAQARPERSDELLRKLRRAAQRRLRPAARQAERDHHGPFQPARRRAARRGRAACAHRRGSRHAGLCLFARDARAPRAGVPRGAGAAWRDVHIAFAIKANPNLAVLRVLRATGLWRRCRLGRRARRARWRRGWRRRTSSSRASARPRAELALGLDAGIGQFNLELEEEGVVLAELAAARGQSRAGGAARQSRCRCRHPCQDLDRQGREQVRRADRSTRRRSSRGSRRCPGSTCAASRSISAASCQTSPRSRRRSSASASWSPSCARPGTRSPMSISAAGSACPIKRRRQSCRARPTMARWSRA